MPAYLTSDLKSNNINSALNLAKRSDISVYIRGIDRAQSFMISPGGGGAQNTLRRKNDKRIIWTGTTDFV